MASISDLIFYGRFFKNFSVLQNCSDVWGQYRGSRFLGIVGIEFDSEAGDAGPAKLVTKIVFFYSGAKILTIVSNHRKKNVTGTL